MLFEAEPLIANVGIAGMKKKGEPTSGDRGTYFKTDEGVLCVILADGMGSGEDAGARGTDGEGGGKFVTEPYENARHFTCGLCRPPARAGKGSGIGNIQLPVAATAAAA